MLRTHKFMVAAVLCIVSLGGCATDNGNDNKPAPQIQSTKDLESYLQTTPASPLNQLSADARQRFVSSLVFTDQGLGSFRYSELKTLSGAQIYQVLSLLGVEHTTSMINNDGPSSQRSKEAAGDHKDYWCSGPGTCSTSSGDICTSNC